ncbi:hypothetical protein PR048_013817 [Dryococelus australis]|uniref:Uncharacterized protein n=1 Tax=Dryococelus australis TaxID=614101 RepID=A0ABQ9HTI6_9NEOP|nr:hypothetical protein PR048_013817 [Dryococelus australis]
MVGDGKQVCHVLFKELVRKLIRHLKLDDELSLSVFPRLRCTLVQNRIPCSLTQCKRYAAIRKRSRLSESQRMLLAYSCIRKTVVATFVSYTDISPRKGSFTASVGTKKVKLYRLLSQVNKYILWTVVLFLLGSGYKIPWGLRCLTTVVEGSPGYSPLERNHVTLLVLYTPNLTLLSTTALLNSALRNLRILDRSVVDTAAKGRGVNLRQSSLNGGRSPSSDWPNLTRKLSENKPHPFMQLATSSFAYRFVRSTDSQIWCSDHEHYRPLKRKPCSNGCSRSKKNGVDYNLAVRSYSPGSTSLLVAFNDECLIQNADNLPFSNPCCRMDAMCTTPVNVCAVPGAVCILSCLSYTLCSVMSKVDTPQIHKATDKLAVHSELPAVMGEGSDLTEFQKWMIIHFRAKGRYFGNREVWKLFTCLCGSKGVSWANRQATVEQLTAQMNQRALMHVPTATVQRSLLRLGPRSRRRVTATMLTQVQLRKWLEFAEQYGDWTAADWRRVAFSEKSRFQLHRTDGRQRIRRKMSREQTPCIHCWNKQGGGGGCVMNHLDRRVRRLSPPRTLQQSWDALQTAWLQIPMENYQHLTESLPACLAAVSAAKGDGYDKNCLLSSCRGIYSVVGPSPETSVMPGCAEIDYRKVHSTARRRLLTRMEKVEGSGCKQSPRLICLSHLSQKYGMQQRFLVQLERSRRRALLLCVKVFSQKRHLCRNGSADAAGTATDGLVDDANVAAIGDPPEEVYGTVSTMPEGVYGTALVEVDAASDVAIAAEEVGGEKPLVGNIHLTLTRQPGSGDVGRGSMLLDFERQPFIFANNLRGMGALRKLKYSFVPGRKHEDIRLMRFVQGDTMKEHTEICKDSSTGNQKVISSIPPATSMGTVYSDDKDVTGNVSRDECSPVGSCGTYTCKMFQEVKPIIKTALMMTDDSDSVEDYDDSLDVPPHFTNDCDGYVTSSIYFHQCSTIDSFRDGADSTVNFFGWVTYSSSAIDVFRHDLHWHRQLDHRPLFQQHLLNHSDISVASVKRPSRTVAMLDDVSALIVLKISVACHIFVIGATSRSALVTVYLDI